MDIQRARILLKKLNSLFNSIDLENGNISSIERDLMLRYIKDLYEAFLPLDAQTEAPAAQPPTQEPVQDAIQDTETKSRPEPQRLKREELMSKPRFFQPDPLPERKEHPPLEIDEPPRQRKSITLNPTPPPEESLQQPEVEQPLQSVAPPSFTPPPSEQVSAGDRADVDQLFSFKRATELSEKLSESPIRDLEAALSINDRLLYTNELFNRNGEELKQALQQLNQFYNMGQAAAFLRDPATQYNWLDDERADIARSFVKLVRRRYL